MLHPTGGDRHGGGDSTSGNKCGREHGMPLRPDAAVSQHGDPGRQGSALWGWGRHQIVGDEEVGMGKGENGLGA